MSNAVLPALAGLKYPASRAPIWSGKVQAALSGAETRLSYWSTPRWRWTIGYEVLRNSGGFTDLQQLVGFYNQCAGQYDDWLWSDPDDSVAAAELFGTGDGATVAFQLSRALGGFSEPVRAVNALTSIVRTDWQGAVALSAVPHGNSLLWSEDFSNAAWSKASATVTANTVTAPDGTTTGDTLDFSASSIAYVLQSSTVAISASTTYTFSVWLVGTPGQTVQIQLQSSGTGLANTAVTITLTAAFARYSITATTGGTASGFMQAVISRGGIGTATILKAWGAMLEAAPAATGYIKTTTAAVALTDYSISATGLVTLAAAPVTGATLAWTGTYYWRVRWDDMDFEMEKMMAGLWSSADLSFTSLKL